jgi:hypothetical protein
MKAAPVQHDAVMRQLVVDVVDEALFTGPNAESDAVIPTGNTVGGKTVQAVSACREMLNASGQVAAKVTFDDFSEAIIRATPGP